MLFSSTEFWNLIFGVVIKSFKIFLLVALSFLTSFNLSANDTFFSIEKKDTRVYDVANGVGTYSTKIKWGIHNIDARPFGNKGYWGKRIKQSDTRVEAYELKINPNNESFYVEHPNGGYVQFENLSSSALQDGKMILQPNNSFYHVYDKPPFLRQKVLDEAIRQVEAAGAKNLTVEWLVSDQKALTQLTQFFSENNVNIIVKFLAE